MLQVHGLRPADAQKGHQHNDNNNSVLRGTEDVGDSQPWDWLKGRIQGADPGILYWVGPNFGSEGLFCGKLLLPTPSPTSR